MRHDFNLTELEILALDGRLNLSDGHARQNLTPSQEKIIDRLPDIFRASAMESPTSVEKALHTTFLDALGQPSHRRLGGRIRTCYSSSVAMEIFARALSGSARSVALVHPTFDNIADILTGNGLDLLPMTEQQVFGTMTSADIPAAADCVFITTPNNPTGRVLNAAGLARIADECAARGIVLALDTSFRGFDERACFDHYAVLEDSTARYAVIEDSGKLWPTLDAKVGILAYSKNLGLPIDRIYTDILLGVSPFIMTMVTSFAVDAMAGGLDRLRAEIGERRSVVRDMLKDEPGVSFPDADSAISVERLELGEQSATALWHQLRADGIDTLPCSPFFWADRSSGDRYLRIALARPADVVVAAASGIKNALLASRRAGQPLQWWGEMQGHPRSTSRPPAGDISLQRT